MSYTILVLFRACKAFLHSTYCSCKNGLSAGKFRKAQIRKFVIYDLQTHYFLLFADLWFADPVLFADFKLQQTRKDIIFLLANIGWKFSDLNFYYMKNGRQEA